MEKAGIVVVSRGGRHYKKIMSYIDEDARSDVRRVASIGEALNIIYSADADVLIADFGSARKRKPPAPGPDAHPVPAYDPLGDASDNIDYLTWYINTHCDERLSLKELAHLIGVTPNHLCRVFRQERGMTVVRYVEKVRLRKAARDLITTDLYVQEICLKYGYRNDSYFAKAFKKEYGLTPIEYRYKMRQKHAPGGNKEAADR